MGVREKESRKSHFFRQRSPNKANNIGKQHPQLQSNFLPKKKKKSKTTTIKKKEKQNQTSQILAKPYSWIYHEKRPFIFLLKSTIALF